MVPNVPLVSQQQMNMSPEEMKKGAEPWMAWFKKYEKEFVDRVTQLVNSIHIARGEASKGITPETGYIIVQAKDVDTVKTLLAAGHYFMMIPGAGVEVFENGAMM